MIATPTEYVWKYNPTFGWPAGAQQNYGATINWVLPGGVGMARVCEDIRSHMPSPEDYGNLVRRFEAESDQQPYAGPRETTYIATSVFDSGPPRSGQYPLDFSGRQRVQLSGGGSPMQGGRSEGKIQLSGGRAEGRVQLSGGRNHILSLHNNRNHSSRPPRWCGAELSGNGIGDEAEIASDAHKYFLRTNGPSQVSDTPGVYSRREFMESFVPAVVKRPFSSQDPGQFPAQYSSLYKGRTAFEDVFWSG